MTSTQPRRLVGSKTARRIECDCREPAVLLATMESDGLINIKSRDRYWHIRGEVNTDCPRCGRSHVINSDAQESEGTDSH